ncbi:hypothetical protein A2803_03970 [Candidatus Woesebacteria bacterium RIFCSPHIGHO2_01_FULL_44_21]|uniref:Glycosyltransferase subfamily 4-like N-terminal domain-containing protein n=1 Tax=Candidatus Woesebacteria bacterium RIFCSPHIGHO2_01_FULL_44_21 TaxID=1802503 RepID=A0A1F7YVG6_9BACT|nr:MAG: hypothetical protein A2803_03970 [Candidatus Woesebacteria bacterium RIFCSPHIGHO2_01_FULL_44_21]
MDVIILSIGFRPNAGGLETHLTDLTDELSKRYKVLVVTLSPLNTNVKARRIEQSGKLTIWRIPWYGGGLFYKLLNYPILEFIYLTPPLVLGMLLALLKYPKVKVIHAQGLSGIIVGGIFGKLFRKRVVVSTHFVYHFGDNFFSKFSKWVYNLADRILCVSIKSGQEMLALGIDESKIGKCAYWINPMVFNATPKDKAKKSIGWDERFSVLFVGRFVKEKGIAELLSALKYLKENIIVYIVGDGPLKEMVQLAVEKNSNATYLGRVDNNKMPVYYSASDVVVVPSYEETLGRVGMEALACGTPVVATNKGGIGEVVNAEVGILFSLSPKNIANAINKLYTNKKLYQRMQSHSREHVLKSYSPNNVEVFIKEYGLQ